MKNLKDLNLTVKDFDLLVEGLEALPERGMAGEMMGSLLMAALSKDKDDSKMENEMEKRRYKREQESKLVKEEVQILQGKLLMMKRYMISNNLISKVHEIID